MNDFHETSWSSHLVTTSLLATLLVGGIAAVFIIWGWKIRRRTAAGGLVLQVIGVAHLLFLVPFVLQAIRGYTMTSDQILVHRLWGETEIPLAGLASVEAVPDAMRGSRRIDGSDGLFRYSGHWRNQLLGDYEVFATDKERTVVLKFETERVVVLSPDDPAEFVRDVERMMAEDKNGTANRR